MPGAVVARPIKVLYTPTTKAACTTLKRLVSEAAGLYNEDGFANLTRPHLTPDQAIHEQVINGFEYFRNLWDDDQQEILESDEWWKVGAVRNPYARVYSAFENNWLLFRGTVRESFKPLYHEVMKGDRLDMTATFEHFVRMLVAHPEVMMADDHFRTQVYQMHPREIGYTHLVHVDRPGELEGFAEQLRIRSRTNVQLRRLNEGLGVKYRDVMSAQTARIIEEVYAEDFATLDYAVEEFPESVEPRILTPTETRLVAVIQQTWYRQWQISIAARGRAGFRYGLEQIGARLKGRTLELFGRAPLAPDH